LTRLDEELGLQHALASRRRYTDGAEMLYDYAERGEDEDAARAARELVVVRSDQRVFNEVVDSYLRRLEFADDGYAQLIRRPPTRWPTCWSTPAGASAAWHGHLPFRRTTRNGTSSWCVARLLVVLALFADAGIGSHLTFHRQRGLPPAAVRRPQPTTGVSAATASRRSTFAWYCA
jgi:hypothetical protein